MAYCILAEIKKGGISLNEAYREEKTVHRQTTMRKIFNCGLGVLLLVTLFGFMIVQIIAIVKGTFNPDLLLIGGVIFCLSLTRSLLGFRAYIVFGLLIVTIVLGLLILGANAWFLNRMLSDVIIGAGGVLLGEPFCKYPKLLPGSNTKGKIGAPRGLR